MKTIFLVRMCIMICFTFMLTHSVSADVTVKGTVRYWDDSTSSYKPVVEAEIRYYNPGGAVSYTDANGYFEKTFTSSSPIDNATVYVFFRNSKLDLRGAITTRSDSRSEVSFDNPPPTVYTLNFDFTDDWANYAKIFDHANKAANFSIAQGFNPTQCIVKYPLQSSIVNQVWISAEGSFFWPSSTVSFPPPDQNFIETILSGIISLAGYFGYSAELTANTIYINDQVKYHPSTVYHEYGHFIMKQKRGDWPVSQTEYATGTVPFNHNSEDTQQNARLAYIEGWANIYEMAVSGWVANPSSPYSVGKYSVGHVSNGYNHELTVANAFWDFYDPAGDENFQTSYANISNVMGEKQNLMSEFISVLAHKSYITDQQRNAGIALMNLTSNKMNPLTSYGNAPMYVKNDFSGGIVNINNSDVNTSALGGTFSTTELWMSTYRTLLAKEQMYDNYHRLFKHANPILPSDTWTTGLSTKKNYTETWSVYTDALTFTANFDRACNITFARYWLDAGATFENNTTAYRSETPVSLSAPDITQSGVTYKFNNWSDGSTANPRPITVSQHQQFTANYKASLASNSASAFTSTSQRKFYKSYYGVMNLVYESMGKVWYERSTDNGTTWQLCNNGQPLSTNPSKLPSLAQGVSNHGVVIVFQEQTSNGYNIVIKEFDAGVQVGSSIVHDSYGQPYSENANPVVQNVFGYLMVVWEADADGGIFYPNGLYYKFGSLNANHQFDFSTGDVIPGTSALCNTPTLSGGGDWDTIRFALAYEENNTIYFRRIKYRWQTENLTISNPVNLSYGNGYTYNYAPSIIAVGSGARVAWIGKRFIHEEELLKSQSGGGYWEYRTIFRDGDANGPFWNFGSNVTAAIINRGLVNGGYAVNAYVVGWSQSTGVPNQYTRHSTLSQIIDIKDASGNLVPGGYLQFTEAVAPTTNEAFQQMPSIAFNTAPALKTFKLSKTVAQLGKESFSQSITTGREGVITIDSGSFYFAFGDISVDDDKISFEEIADTTRIDSLTSILRYLESKPFAVNNNSQYIYGVQYGFSDSTRCLSSLTANDFVKFKIELIDNTSQHVIGTFDNITYTNSNVNQHQNLAYQVNTNGIGSREVKLRLSIEVSRYTTAALANKFADYSVLGLEKESIHRKRISYLGTLAVTSYELSQNYPNPFNPTTTINYSLPRSGDVRLVVSDYLGREVAVLAEGFKAAGMYDVQFDASKLASGVYFYSIRVGSYSVVKRMMLLK